MQMLDAERARGFEGLAGSAAEVTIPIRQALIDAALLQVTRWPAPLEALGLGIGSGNILEVAAAIKVFGFGKHVRLRLRIAPAVEDGILRLFLDDRSLASNAIAFLGPLLGQLPGGVTLEGRQIVLDITRLAADQGFDDLVHMLSSASFEAEEGILWITARVDVTSRAGAAASPQRPATTPAPLPFQVDDLIAWLRGMRIEADVRADERLANDLLAAAHADAHTAATTGPRTAAAAVAASLRRPTVQFEQGAIRLTIGADVQPADRPPGT